MADTRSLSSSPDLQNRAHSHQVTPPLSPLSKPAKPLHSSASIAASTQHWHSKPHNMLQQPISPTSTSTIMHTSPAIAIDAQRAPSPGLWNPSSTDSQHTPLHQLQHRPSSSKSSSYRDTLSWKSPQISDMANPQIVIRRVSKAEGSDDEATSRPDSSRGGHTSDNDDSLNALDVPNHHRKSSHGEQDLQSIDETEIVGTIDLTPCPSTWLVGFEDRPKEMKHVMELPQNKPIFDEIKHRVGADAYENQLLPLWTETPREQMGDIHWLVKSRRVILPDLDVPEYFKFIWRRFAGVVGWEGNDKDLDIGRRASTRQNSTASFSSNSSRRLDSYWE